MRLPKTCSYRLQAHDVLRISQVFLDNNTLQNAVGYLLAVTTYHGCANGDRIINLIMHSTPDAPQIQMRGVKALKGRWNVVVRGEGKGRERDG